MIISTLGLNAHRFLGKVARERGAASWKGRKKGFSFALVGRFA
jgi:hypothetical protein